MPSTEKASRTLPGIPLAAYPDSTKTIPPAIAGPGPLAVAAAAGPWCVGAMVARKREGYRRAVERSVPDIAAAIRDPER